MKKKTTRALAKQAIKALPILAVDQLYDPEQSLRLRGDVNTAAGKMIRLADPMAAQFHKGLCALDDYNRVEVCVTDAAFRLGVEYGLRIGGAK